MKNIVKLFVIGTCTLLALASIQIPLTRAKSLSTISTKYQPSDKNFPNPERGFATPYEAWPPGLKITWKFCNTTPENVKKYTFTGWTDPLDLTLLKAQRNQGISLATVRYHIAEFRNKPLSTAFLNRLNSDFATTRKAGLKLVIHFAYNWPMGGPDAPVDKVLLHLDQLKPVLRKNVDVISFMDAGFIGCWGEWHTSSNNLIGTDRYGQAVMNKNSRLIIDKIFEVLPKERMVAVRYPRYKFDYFGSKDLRPIAPLKPSEAFTGSKKARWGQEDDCLVCGEWNASTYWSPRQKSEEIKNYLNQDNHYVVQSGEPGDIPDKLSEDQDGDGYVNNYESCPRVLNIFSRMRWSSINGGYNLGSPTSSNKRWQKDGCYEEIAQKLGYRFRLVESSIPRQVKSGGKLSMSFKIANDGWASPYNPRKLEIILRNRKNRSITRMPLRNDPRFWQAGGQYLVKVNNQLPKLAAGAYDVLLNLPDPKPTLKNRSEYAIRLANQDVWEEATGYNSLLRSIVVE
jgi:Domain of unknown function (DUF4832)/Domain of unknown function (DUF4874)